MFALHYFGVRHDAYGVFFYKSGDNGMYDLSHDSASSQVPIEFVDVGDVVGILELQFPDGGDDELDMHKQHIVFDAVCSAFQALLQFAYAEQHSSVNDVDAINFSTRHVQDELNMWQREYAALICRPIVMVVQWKRVRHATDDESDNAGD